MNVDPFSCAATNQRREIRARRPTRSRDIPAQSRPDGVASTASARFDRVCALRPQPVEVPDEILMAGSFKRLQTMFYCRFTLFTTRLSGTDSPLQACYMCRADGTPLSAGRGCRGDKSHCSHQSSLAASSRAASMQLDVHPLTCPRPSITSSILPITSSSPSPSAPGAFAVGSCAFMSAAEVSSGEYETCLVWMRCVDIRSGKMDWAPSAAFYARSVFKKSFLSRNTLFCPKYDKL